MSRRGKPAGTRAPALSVCLIVRNEEAHLARCLESVRTLADELIVVDTGSTDRTLEIAGSFGARTFHAAWQDDFSLARNYCIAQATGDWILSIDADETIAARDRDVIRRMIRTSAADAILAIQRNYLAAGTVAGWTPGPGGYDEGAPYDGFVDIECRRLFRNRPSLRFRSPVHEELVSTDPSRPLAQGRGSWVIHHFGKTADAALVRAKAEAYLRIGLKKVEDHPASALAHYELGVQYFELGRPADAQPSLERALALSPGFRDAQLFVATCQARRGEPAAALATLRALAGTLPTRAAEIALEEGNALRELGDGPAAEQAFERALSINPSLAAAAVNLALLRLATGRLALALACLDAALERAPRHVEARLLRAQLRRRRGDDPGALSDLEQLGAHDGALRLRARVLAQHRRFQDARDCLARLGEAADADLAALRGAVALGLGDFPDAVRQLQSSLRLHPSYEAARNLSAALEASGDRAAALQIAAEAVALAPDAAAALRRFGQLAGSTFRRRASLTEGGSVTVFICHDAASAAGEEGFASLALGGALARHGHRVVVFAAADEAAALDGVEHADRRMLAVRCLRDRPDLLVGVRTCQPLADVRLAPLQIFWDGNAGGEPVRQAPDGPLPRREIDFFLCGASDSADALAVRYEVARWRILGVNEAAADARPDWTAIARAASKVDPPGVQAIAIRLAAGQAPLALALLQRLDAPALPATDALRAVVLWRAGAAAQPAGELLRRAALDFASLRHPRIIEPSLS